MSTQGRKVIYSDIPSHHRYAEVWELQKHLQQRLIKQKRSGIADAPGYLLLCEHSPVFTIGKSGKIDHLIASEEQLAQEETEFFKINRGGDITFHGPGQITGYPILDLDQYYNDVHRYVRELEEVVIRTIAHYGLKGDRIDGFTGVWLTDGEKKRKICAIGVHMSRWVSMHGFALNVQTNLSYFKQIIPCGIVEPDKSVTSIAQEVGIDIDLQVVKELLKKHFSEMFGFELLSTL